MATYIPGTVPGILQNAVLLSPHNSDMKALFDPFLSFRNSKIGQGPMAEL